MKKNQLKIGVVLSYVAIVANMAVQLAYTPVMIRVLGQSEYGLYSLVGSVVSYLSLFSFGFNGAYLRFYSRMDKAGGKESVARLNGMFLVIFAVMGIAATICGFILSNFPSELFGSNLTPEELEKSQILMRILVINIALSFPASVFDSIVSAHEKFVFQKILVIAGTIINPLICLPLLLTGHGSIVLVMAATLITVLKICANMVFCFGSLKVKFLFLKLDWKLIGEISNFSFFLFLNMILDQVTWSVDKFILGRVSGTNAVAVYGVGAAINTLVVTFSSSVSSVFAPRVNKIAAENDKQINTIFTDLFIKVGRIQFMIVMLLVSGFIIFGKYFITDYYASAEYGDSYYVALLLIVPEIIALIQNIGLEIQRAVNKHRFRSIVYCIIAVFNLLISIPLAKVYGPIGAALGSTISLVLSTGIIMNVYYSRGIGLDIPAFWKSILSLAKGILIPAITGFGILHFVSYGSFFEYGFFILLYTVIYGVSFWIFGMNAYEHGLVMTMIKRFGKHTDKSDWEEKNG